MVTGSEGELQMDRPLTRAEFVTILYRLADQYLPASSYTGQTDTGAVLSGDTALADLTAGDLWLDHSVSQIQLTNVTAGTVTVRSDVLEGLSLEGTGHLDRLVLAARSGDVTLSLPETYSLGTLVVGDGTGTVDLPAPPMLWRSPAAAVPSQ